MQENPQNTRVLTVLQWRELTMNGAAPPVSVYLSGCSMRPIIRGEKDIVTIVPLYRPLKRGDVVLFARYDGKYVVHRVYALGANNIQTLGDGCIRPDSWMPVKQVWGLITGVKRFGRVCSLDTDVARALGCAWMKLLPLRRAVRRLYLRLRHLAGNALRAMGLRK